MGVPMEGFFDGTDVAFATPAPSAAAHGVPAETPTPPTEPVPREEGTHTEGVSKTIPISTETLTPSKGVISPVAVQTEAASAVLSFIISTSDPFATLSQAVKDGSSLVVTPSSIPSSATRGPDTDLSSEGSEDILEDSDNAPVLKKRIFDSDEEESAPPEPEFMGICLPPFLLSSLFFFLLLLPLPRTYVFVLLLAVVSLSFVCLFPCLQRPLRG